jgi:ABC-type multidrug transport system fused ATPase/permease subunit
LALAVAAYGLGHGALALAAGLIGRALAGAGTADVGGWTVGEISYIGLGAAIVKAGSGIFLAFSEANAARGVGLSVRAGVVAGLLDGGMQGAPPRVLATIAVRVREIEGAVVHGVIASVRSVGQLVPLGLALILVSPRLALGGVLLLLPFALGTAALRRRWRRSHAKAQELVEELHTGVDELIKNLDLFRSYGAGDRVERSILRAGRAARRSDARVEALRAALSGGNEVLGAFALVGAIALAKALALPLGDGTLVAFAAVFFMAYRPLRDLGDARSWLARGAVALEAVDGVATESVGPRETTPAQAWDPTVHIEARGLGAVGHGPRTSFAAASGEMVCIVGPTGSGKTTLLRAMLGLECAAGSLSVSERDVTAAPVGPAGRPFAWVPQEAPLITGTVLENAALWNGDEATSRAALLDIGANRLLALEHTLVGPGGRALSGGESRQLSLARALASGLPVLLLDEPTAGLDRASGLKVLDALERLKGRRTLIVVTHRPEVVALADRVVEVGSSRAA